MKETYKSLGRLVVLANVCNLRISILLPADVLSAVYVTVQSYRIISWYTGILYCSGLYLNIPCIPLTCVKVTVFPLLH